MTALNEGLSQPQSRKALHPVMERLGKIKKEYQGVAHHYDTDVVLSPKTDRLEKITWMPNEAYRQASQASGCYTIATTQTQWSLDDMVNHYNQLGEIERIFRSLKSELGRRPIFHRKVSRIKAHLFITVVSFYVVPLVRTKMKALNIHYRWERLREELSLQRRTTTKLPQRKDQYLLVSKDQNLTEIQKTIYQAMDLPRHHHLTRKVVKTDP